MAEIEFDIENDKITERSNAYLSKVVFGGKKTSVMVRALKKLKLAKTDNQAYYVLFYISTLFFLLSLGIIIYIIFHTTQNNTASDDLPPWLKKHIENQKLQSQ